MSLSIRKTYLFFFSLFLLFFVFSSSRAFSSVPREGFDEHFIEVRLDFDQRRIIGKDEIRFAATATLEISLIVDRDIRIKSVELAGRRTALPFRIILPGSGGTRGAVKELIITLPAMMTNPRVTIYFEGIISPIESARMSVERGVSFSGDSVMGEPGAFLPASSFWFPRRLAPFAYYDILVSLPLGFKAVMEGTQLFERHTESRSVIRYKTDTPGDGVNLIAADFVVKSESYEGIDIYTYFYVDDERLSRTYIDKMKFYIDASLDQFPPYPYMKFAIVENFLPTGFGMPSFTLLGSTVLRLPFIPDTALGHEFVHNWWGNGVFIDPSTGNWAEALASYTADHYFKERAGGYKASAYRLKALSNYANYAGASSRSVSSFRFGTSTEARAIGYSKGMMIFHMLRGEVGDALFYASLRRFYTDNAFTPGSWEDIRLAFEEVCERNLGWFFDQWLSRPSGPKLKIEEPRYTLDLDGNFTLSILIKQESPVYRLKVPVLIKTRVGVKRMKVTLDSALKEFTWKLSSRPLSIEVDPDTDIFRILSGEEIPSSLASILGSRESRLILPVEPQYRERYKLIAKKISEDFGLGIIEDALVLDVDIRSPGPSFFILGGLGESAVFDKILDYLPQGLVIEEDSFMVDGERYEISDHVLAAAFRVGERRVAIFFGALSSVELERIGARISHLTSKGFLVFKRGGELRHGTFEGKKSLRYEFSR